MLESLDPGQQVVKIVNEELAALMGGASRDLAMASTGTTVILMAGLQGSGKTTACAKLAKHLGDGGKKVALAACDTQRPAAVEQLVTMGKRAGATVYEQGTERDPVDIAEWALGQARSQRRDVLIVDTAGRLHVDEELMDELVAIRKRTKPHDVLLVLDAMTGQDAVNVADSFAERVDFDGVVLTKLDGDARGGAALSVKAVTGKPILYASTGERIEQLERFHPERMASRILGMGDVMSLIEKAEEVSDADQAAELERKIRKQQFTLEDFLDADEAGPQDGPAAERARDDARHGQGDEAAAPGRHGRARARPPRGDHPLDDAGRAGEPDGDRRLAAQADRARLGHDGPGGQPARQAVRPDAQDDGRDGARARCPTRSS